MKILHIHPSMEIGGIESMIVGLTNECVADNDVHILTIFKPTEKDVMLNRLDKRVKIHSLGKTSSGFSFKEPLEVFYFLRRNQFDVVHIHGFFYYYWLPVFLLHQRIKFFYTVHSDAFMENVRWDRKLFIIKKTAFKRDYITPVTISKTSNESFRKLYKMEAAIIENGTSKPRIDSHCKEFVDSFRKSTDTRVFIHAGRITEAKNQEALCKVFSKLIDDKKDIVLLIAGFVQDREIFSRMEPFFSDRIVYLGTRDDVSSLMAYCDAMCLPSIWEGLPMVLLESLAVGCIPICSPVGGIVNVIKEKENGILSASSSENDYSKAIMRYLDLSANEITQIKQNCIDSFEPFNISHTAQSYLNLYKNKTAK